MNPEKVYKLVKKIPKGKVSTYKVISEVTGIHPRVVGMILHRNPDPVSVPCYRIIRSDGSLGGYSRGIRKKIELLRKDGIKIKNEKVELKKYLYSFD